MVPARARTARLPVWYPWDDMKTNKMTVVLLVLALGMIGFGLFRGEGAAVLQKGINLCLECVGIG